MLDFKTMAKILDLIRRSKRYQIILLGLFVHILLLGACFDLYFASPLDHGMTPIKSTSYPPVKRVVLFVADGLRAEAIYGKDKQDRIPFLRNIMNNEASWGTSHTRVPTESRPGHVALLGGIYEDPSAIFRGWKANPVEFDSVINQSTNAWCWGSPDILNLFKNNKFKQPHINLESYDSEMEDFGKRNSGALDLWVFQKVQDFLQKIKTCNNACTKYFEQGNLIFLHLLGIDTAGHGFKPHSKEYIENIKLVDQNVETITKLVKETFKDNSTVFIFTSDHGMTDWGSHGAGTLHETEAPIIVWGPGVKFNKLHQNIHQIDIAPLISSLLGINFPINSLGVVPRRFLNVHPPNLAGIVLANTMQLIETFNVKRWRTEKNALVFVPFQGLTDITLDGYLDKIHSLMELKKFDEVMKSCDALIKVLIEGLDYYHNYYQRAILVSVTLGLLVWLFYLVSSVESLGQKSFDTSLSLEENLGASIIFCVVVTLCWMQKFPLTYYCYFLFPLSMLYICLQQRKSSSVKFLVVLKRLLYKKEFYLSLVFYLLGIELLVVGFFYRLSYSFVMVLVGLSILVSPSLKNTSSKNEKILWIFCCSILSVFPTLPVMKTSFNIPLYVFGIVVWMLLFLRMYLNNSNLDSRQIKNDYKVFVVQFVCLLLAGIYILALEFELFAEDSNVKYLSWLFLLLPICLVPFTSRFIVARLMATFFAFAPFYLLVSPNFEVLFAGFYAAMLFLWLMIESKAFHQTHKTNLLYYTKFDVYKSKESKFQSDSIRRAFLFMVFIFLGFFGTGNIASLNSFDPMWVRAFLTVFSPFKMMGIILLKIMVPFIFACCVFKAINAVSKENVLSTFCIILIFSDVMVMQFLYLVNNQGSWLDIGTSLSHFIIMEGFVTILLLLYGMANWLTSVSYKLY